MFFSIIIPTFNRAEILKETLQSVLQQNFEDYEIIVVDDGSTDNTSEIVLKVSSPKIKYFRKKNEERSVARNFGADKGVGEYLIFLDSDDKMQSNHLNCIHQFITCTNPRPEFTFSGYKVMNSDGSLSYEFGVKGVFNSNRLIFGNPLGCSSVTVSAKLFKKYYFNTDRKIIMFEDWELWLRILKNNKLYCLPEKSITMTNHDGRSVLATNVKELTSRVHHYKNHVLETSEIIKSSFLNKRKFVMGIYSYAALHVALTKKNRAIALKYFFLSCISHPSFIFKRRFFGIIKQLI